MFETHYIASLSDPAKRVELFATVPQGEGSWPAVVYVHGHQHPVRPGGGAIERAGLLERVAAAGVLGVSLFQPGYGGSDGPPDYCGPTTQSAILAALRYAVERLGTQPSRIAIIGASRGAIAAAVAAADAPELGALVVSAGVYDLAAGYRDCPWSGIRKHIEQEAGTSARGLPSTLSARQSVFDPLSGADHARRIG